MTTKRRRMRILCEDRRTERFLRRLCERFGVQVLDVKIAPSGKGAASAWVRQHYADEVRRHRARNYQASLALLVAIDGDNVGVAERVRELAEALAAAKEAPRVDSEAIAVFVPTWSVETWLAALVGRPVDELSPQKDNPAVSELWRDGPAESRTIREAVAGWGADTALPSLIAARSGAVRVGLA